MRISILLYIIHIEFADVWCYLIIEYCLNILSGNTQQESILGLNSLIDVGYRYKEVLGMDEKFSSASVLKVT